MTSLLRFKLSKLILETEEELVESFCTLILLMGLSTKLSDSFGEFEIFVVLLLEFLLLFIDFLLDFSGLLWQVIHGFFEEPKLVIGHADQLIVLLVLLLVEFPSFIQFGLVLLEGVKPFLAVVQERGLLLDTKHLWLELSLDNFDLNFLLFKFGLEQKLSLLVPGFYFLDFFLQYFVCLALLDSVLSLLLYLLLNFIDCLLEWASQFRPFILLFGVDCLLLLDTLLILALESLK